MANSNVIYRGPDGRCYTDITTNKTLTAADCGVVQNIIASGIVMTLPGSVVGMDFTIRNQGAAPTGAPVGAGANGNPLTIAPNASDGISGLAFTATVNKALYNQGAGVGATTAASATGVGAIACDEIELVGSVPSGAAAWEVSHAIGYWQRQT